MGKGTVFVTGASTGIGRADADSFRGIMDMVYCLAWPEQVYARPQVAEAMARFGTTEPPPLLGPDRDELLSLIS